MNDDVQSLSDERDAALARAEAAEKDRDGYKRAWTTTKSLLARGEHKEK